MMLSCDFETTKNPDNSMRVWMADICTIDGLYAHSTHDGIETFVDEAFADDNILYFHNLKFDGSYLINYLHSIGYIWADHPQNPGEMSFLVTDRNVWFMGMVISKEGKIINIRDSLKKIPLPVSRIPEAYDLPVFKGEIDYKAPRPLGYRPSEKEISYVRRDTEIVARALYHDISNGFTALTAPADAMEDYKKRVDFDRLFVPKWWITHMGAEAFVRKAYVGGISWVNPEVSEKRVGAGVIYDYNSMYPSVMMMYEYPYGYPARWYDTPPKGYLYVARCKVNIMKRPEAPACIRDRERKLWIDGTYEGELYLTSVDIELLQTCYDGECELLDGYAFKSQKGMFDCFINHWAEIKKTSKGAKRYTAKRMQNSFYGKFGTNPHRAHKTPVWDESGLLHWQTSEPEDGKTFNIAVAAFVTAYARRELIRGYFNADGIVCYMDTDSLHIIGRDGKAPHFNGKIHESEYGCWKCEGVFRRAKYLRQKTYIEDMGHGKMNIAACGCPESSKRYIRFGTFKMGATFPGKLIPRMRRGGVELTEGTFTIKEPPMRF